MEDNWIAFDLMRDFSSLLYNPKTGERFKGTKLIQQKEWQQHCVIICAMKLRDNAVTDSDKEKWQKVINYLQRIKQSSPKKQTNGK